MLETNLNKIKLFVMAVFFMVTVLPHQIQAADSREPSTLPINAFFLNNVPVDYGKLEKLFLSLKEGGANTIILRPTMDKGRIDKNTLTNNVFLAHHAGLAIFVILPTRGMAAALVEHPDWKDIQFDLGRWNTRYSEKLDLFNPKVIDYLAALSKNVASYAVDGILLGEDSTYSDMEGMSDRAMKAYKKKFGSPLAVDGLFSKVGVVEGVPVVEEYGAAFWDWTELKKDALAELFQRVAQSARAVNKEIKFGIPLPVTGLVTSKDLLAHYAYDRDAFSKLPADLYWMAVSHRELRARKDLTYKKSMEMLSRIVTAAINLMKDPAKAIFLIQATSQTGSLLPISEIEEAVEMVKHAGEPGIAFMINADTQVPAVLTKKIFRRR